MRTASHSRVAWIDYAKAFGIVLVVMGHVNSGIAKTPGLAMGEGLKLLNAFIYSFHMPLFFTLAGFVIFLRKQASTENVVRDAVWSLALPYVVWSALWIGMKAGMREFTDNPVTLARLVTILWEPIGHMWFLFQLFFIRLGWHGFERVLPFSGRMAVLVLAALASAAFVWMGPAWVTPWFYLQNFAFFGFGLLVLPYLALPERRSRSLAHAALGLIAWGVAYPAVNLLNGPFTGLLLGMLGTLSFVLLARALPAPRTQALRVLAYLGEASMAIYVMHLFVTTAARKGLGAAGLLSEPTLLAVATPLGILIPAAVFWAILRTSRETGLPIARNLGLGQAVASRYLDDAGERIPASAPLPAAAKA